MVSITEKKEEEDSSKNAFTGINKIKVNTCIIHFT